MHKHNYNYKQHTFFFFFLKKSNLNMGLLIFWGVPKGITFFFFFKAIRKNKVNIDYATTKISIFK